jgi:putative transposase
MKTKHAREYGINPLYLPPPGLWEKAKVLIPAWPPRPKGGRPPMPDEQAFYAIYYVLRTGIQWNALPRELGASSTVHDRFQKWVHEGVFTKLWKASLILYDQEKGINWEWQSLDAAITKAPLGSENTGPNPTDRGKKGTKRHLLTEGNGMPLAVVITGANRHDKTQTENVLCNIVIERPKPTDEKKQHLCLDKGYDYDDIRVLLIELDYIEHIKSRGEEISDKIQVPNYRARRWVVERTHSWMNRYRRLLIRWEKKTDNFEAFIHLACASIVWRAAEVFG